jgi:L-amino acid N-acyltransferase YncA
MSEKVAELSISPMSGHDWQAVRQIYLDGIATELATFEKLTLQIGKHGITNTWPAAA